MQLVERHIIKKGHSLYKEIDSACFLAKNLYNKANYIVRQEFINTSREKEAGIREQAHWIRNYKLQTLLQGDRDVDYYALPTKVSQQVLRTLDRNWRSFFASIKDWKKNPQKYNGLPSLPKYKHKTKGRGLLTYTIQAIFGKELGKGIIHLSGTTIAITTKQTNIQQVRVVPGLGFYVIEIIYKKEVNDLKLNKENIAGIDLGVNNLAAVTSNTDGVRPLLINGRPLKSMNQYFNKKNARLQSFVGNKSSNRLHKLTNKRNRKIDNYLHHASSRIVDHLIANDIGTDVIGKNVGWKTECGMSKRNNQHFVAIPHARLIQQIKYKCQLVGIAVLLTEERHTSKCSFIDNEPICHQEHYLGHRKHRGLFVSSTKIKLNADCNGSGNIVRKVFPNAFANGIQGVVVRPVRITPYKLAS